MTENNRIAAIAGEAVAWRHDLHMYPELAFKESRTSGIIAQKLKEFGVDEVHTGFAGTGIVAVINGSADTARSEVSSSVSAKPRSIGLRADMDALPIEEIPGESERPHRSRHDGVMHACGHDGHVSIMLAVAKYLSETRRWSGTVHLYFQPAEEEGSGAKVMIDDGVLDRFDCDEIYAFHNMPNLPFGSFATKPGPLMASSDVWDIIVRGRGGHAAHPDQTRDPITAASALVQSLQTVISRSNNPLDTGVLSVTRFHAGDAYNVIPHTANLSGTLRSFSTKARSLQQSRVVEICAGIGAAFGVEVEFIHHEGHPVLSNHAAQVEYACKVATELVGSDAVDANTASVMSAEDFSFFTQARPGAMVFVGVGDGPHLHHPEFDFNDDIIPLVTEFFVRLVEQRLGV